MSKVDRWNEGEAEIGPAGELTSRCERVCNQAARDTVREATTELMETIRSLNGIPLAVLLLFKLPCGTDPLLGVHWERIDGIEDGLRADEVTALRKGIDALRTHLDKHYPPT